MDGRMIRLVLSAGALCVGACPVLAAEVEKTPLPVRGMIRPLNQAAIATDLQARVAEVNFKEGEAFEKGALLVAFDCERQQAELAATRAQHRETKLALESAAYLDKKGAVGRFDVEVSRARVDKTAADVAALEARLKQCTIVAPYDGRVSELLINAHEIPTPGKPFISVVDETAFEIELIVPSQWLRTIAIGARFAFTVDELGSIHTGRLIRIGAAVDPVSQTIKVIGRFDEKPLRVLSGMSGSAVFEGQKS
jgi:membrane fusion protein, multidrug efflux system